MRNVWVHLLAVVAVAAAACAATTDDRSDEFPRTILQIGAPRTATSLQFSTLCAAAAVRFMHRPEVKVVCGFNLWDQVPNTDPNKVVVMKAHSFAEGYKQARLRRFRRYVNSTMVFATAREASPDGAPSEMGQALARFGLRVAFTAVTTDVARDGYRVGQAQYRDLLGLSAAESAQLLDWLGLWSDIRVCCGAQMSDAWRHTLAPDAPRACTSFAAAGGDDAATAAAAGRAKASAEQCAALNISDVERRFMRTELYQQMRERVPLLGRASTRDSDLTGDYCETCNRNVAKYNLGHNDRCVGVADFAHMKRWSMPCAHTARERA